MITCEAIATLKPYVPGKPIEDVQRELGLSDILKLASNEHVYGPSPQVLAALQAPETLSELWRYPDPGTFKLRHAIADFHQLSPDRIVPGNGSNELINLLVRCFVQPGQNTLSSAGSFIAYRVCTRAHGHHYLEAPLGPDMGYDLDALLAATTPETRLIFIANPNNPTGTLLSPTALERFLTQLDAQPWGPAGPPIVALDEAYIEFIAPASRFDSLSLFASRPRTVLLRTFSKAYGLAALRLGYAICSPEIADLLNRIREPFNINALAQIAGQHALADQAWMHETVGHILTERARVHTALEALDLHPIPSQTNFIFFDTQRDAHALYDALLHRGIITRPMAAAGFPRHLRVTIGTPADNSRFLSALEDTLKAIPPAAP